MRKLQLIAQWKRFKPGHDLELHDGVADLLIRRRLAKYTDEVKPAAEPIAADTTIKNQYKPKKGQ